MLLTKVLNQKLSIPWYLSEYCGLHPLDWWHIRKMPRYTKGSVSLCGASFEYVDGHSLLEGLNEIYLDKCYQFVSSSDSPMIIDCGANIGLSVLYFKKLYPNAKIIAFEADPLIFETLSKNVNIAGLSGVEIINKAVWDSEQVLTFRSEGGLSGRVAIGKEQGNYFSIQGSRLRDYLDQKVDFLKIDIEGAEGRVINDCSDRLINVDRIFLEHHSHHAEPQNLSDVLDILRWSGFRYYIKEAYVPSAPFISCPTLDGMDLQLNIFGVRK